MTTSKPVTPRPPLRMKLSIARGNLIQAAAWQQAPRCWPSAPP